MNLIPIPAAAAVAILAIGGRPALAPPRAPAALTITGTDYAFHLPAHIRRGETTFAFENHGTVRHEMVIARLKPGISGDSAMRSIQSGSRRRDFIDGQVGLVVSEPGEPAEPRVWLDLLSGRTYLVVCNLVDAPDKPPHARLGMIATFQPE